MVTSRKKIRNDIENNDRNSLQNMFVQCKEALDKGNVITIINDVMTNSAPPCFYKRTESELNEWKNEIEKLLQLENKNYDNDNDV